MSTHSNRNSEVESLLAQSCEEAAERFEYYKSRDPFPGIAPALLNSSDVYDYIAATGLIYPFYPNKLKSASYAVSILGKVVFCTEEGEKSVRVIDWGEEFTLQKNSIAFITLEPMFRLPDYIALRFNLKITHVYRGLLLGTGPLVDPGFYGKLSIPLHNLTANDYRFTGGEDLIWMEFTKLSPNERWHNDAIPDLIPRQGRYVPFPPTKTIADVEDYLRKADSQRNIRSSIPETVLEASRSATEAVEIIRSTQRRITIGGIVSGIAVFLALLALFLQVNSLVQDSLSYVRAASQNIPSLEEKLDREIENMRSSSQQIQALQTSIQELTQEVRELQRKLDSNL